MKTALLLALASSIALCGCSKAPDPEQPGLDQTDPIVTRIEKDFPGDRFEIIHTPGSAPDIRLDRRTGCIYDSRGEPILAADRQPDCSYKPTSSL